MGLEFVANIRTGLRSLGQVREAAVGGQEVALSEDPEGIVTRKN